LLGEEIALAAHRAKIQMAVEQIQKEAERLASGVVGLTRSAAGMPCAMPSPPILRILMLPLSACRSGNLAAQQAAGNGMFLTPEEVKNPFGLTTWSNI